MKKIFSLLVLASALVTAQSHRFVYEYKYIPNIKEKDSVQKDLMALDITEKGSVYQSLGVIERDSTIQAKIAEFNKTKSFGKIEFAGGGKFNKGTVNYKVTKDYPDYKVFLNLNVATDRYKISDDKKMDWKISTESQKIGNYTAQKATTNFGGRSWIAWFTTDLPFPDGPYKFHGLPGLIIKLEDVTGSHIMTLVANKKLPVKEEATGGNFSMFAQQIEVNENQFKKAWKNYIADPGKNLRELSSRSSGGFTANIVMTSDKGKPMDMKEIIKNQEKAVKKMLETDNNRIEPTLYQ